MENETPRTGPGRCFSDVAYAHEKRGPRNAAGRALRQARAGVDGTRREGPRIETANDRAERRSSDRAYAHGPSIAGAGGTRRNGWMERDALGIPRDRDSDRERQCFRKSLRPQKKPATASGWIERVDPERRVSRRFEHRRVAALIPGGPGLNGWVGGLTRPSGARRCGALIRVWSGLGPHGTTRRLAHSANVRLTLRSVVRASDANADGQKGAVAHRARVESKSNRPPGQPARPDPERVRQPERNPGRGNLRVAARNAATPNRRLHRRWRHRVACG